MGIFNNNIGRYSFNNKTVNNGETSKKLDTYSNSTIKVHFAAF